MKTKFYIKEKFKDYLNLRGWNINDLSSKLGMKKQQVSSTINGKIEPTMNFLHRLCDLTELDLEEIIETKR